MNSLLAISPVDGRYYDKVDDLRPIFSEMGLMKKRLEVEIAWLILLAQESTITEIPALSSSATEYLKNILEKFSLIDAEKIKKIEETTNHDVKAIEYFLKEKMQSNAELKNIAEFVHFACTSEDINNLSYALMQKEALHNILLPKLKMILENIIQKAKDYIDISLLSRTHGQPATPSTLGKEFANVAYRLQRQIQQLEQQKFLGKFNGAVGNFNAHVIAYPEIDWRKLSKQLITQLGLQENPYTTQIEPHDFIAELSHSLIRANTILIDLARDIWGYISLDYFKQKVKSEEVGSSTMPHKVNPIDFENAEGNLTLANALFDFFAIRLPISRWQRDLVDSTLLRNLGVAFSHAFIGYQSLERGLKKLLVNIDEIEKELATQWAVLTEAIQTVMRRYQVANPYEQLKALSRGKNLDENDLKIFIQQLPIPEAVKNDLVKLTPKKYIGLAAILTKQMIENS